MIRIITMALAAMLFTSAASAVELGPLYIEGNIGATVDAQNDRDSDVVLAAKIGRKVFNNNIRADFGLNLTEYNGSSGEGDVEVYTALGGVYYDFNNKTKFTPFAGVNLGYGWADGSGSDSSDDSGMVYGATFGVAYELYESVDILGGYQYLTSSDIEVSDGKGTDEWASSAVTAGVRFKF